MSKYMKNVSVKKDEMRISIITKKSPEMLSTQKNMTKFERPLCSSLKDSPLDGKSEPLCSEATANINRFLTPWACTITDLVQHSCFNRISFHNILAHWPARLTRPASPLYLSSIDMPQKQISELSLLQTTSEFRVKLSWRLGFISSKLW